MASVEKDFRLKSGLIVGNGLVNSDVSTVSLFNTGVTTLNFGQAATAISIGATTGTTTIRNALSVTGNITGTLIGNASTATTLQTARTISLSGDVTGSVSFDGGSNVTITATIAPDSVALGTDTTGNYIATGAVSGNGLTGSATGEGSTFTVTSNATAANTASTIVFRDAAGSFSATDITLTGDLAVNGGDINTSAATSNVVNANATTVNFAGAATSLTIGATTGTTTIRNANTVVTGDLAVNGGDITTAATTATVFDTTATTVHIGRAATTASIGAGTGTTTVNNNLSVAGNLIVNGTTTTVNSTTVTLDDPIITLGGDTAPATDDNKDRGVEFRWHNGTAAQVGFFGFDDSTGFFTFIPSATNTAEVFSGATGVIDVNRITGSAATLTTARNISLAGDVTGTVSFNGGADVTINTTIAANSVALGADTTGDYVATASVSGNGLTGSATGEGSTFTVTSNATAANTASTIVFRDASGNFSASNITLTGDIAVNGGDVTTTATTATVFDTAATTVHIGRAATTASIGATTGTTTINNDLTVSGGDIILGGTGRIQGIDTVTDPTDAVSKSYVDNLVANASPVETTTTLSAAGSVYSYSASAFRTAKIVIQATHATAGFHSAELFVTHNNTDAHWTEYADIFTVSSLFSLSVDITGGNVVVTATPTNTNTTFKVVPMLRVTA